MAIELNSECDPGVWIISLCLEAGHRSPAAEHHSTGDSALDITFPSPGLATEAGEAAKHVI